MTQGVFALLDSGCTLKDVVTYHKCVFAKLGGIHAEVLRFIDLFSLLWPLPQKFYYK